MMDYANMLRQLMMGAQPIADDPMTRKINKGLPTLGGGGGYGGGGRGKVTYRAAKSWDYNDPSLGPFHLRPHAEEKMGLETVRQIPGAKSSKWTDEARSQIHSQPTHRVFWVEGAGEAFAKAAVKAGFKVYPK
jgi:hypothetical protein